MNNKNGELKKGDYFNCNGVQLCILDESPQMIQNPFSGEECTLTPEAIAVYDYIKGAEHLRKPFRAQLEYFMKKWPEEYMILLD